MAIIMRSGLVRNHNDLVEHDKNTSLMGYLFKHIMPCARGAVALVMGGHAIDEHVLGIGRG